MSLNPLRCPSCNKGLMEARMFPWKKPVAIACFITLILSPMGFYLLTKPDWYECPACGRKKLF